MSEENIKVTGVYVGLYDVGDKQMVQINVDVEDTRGSTLYSPGRTMSIADAEELFVQALRMIRARQKKE